MRCDQRGMTLIELVAVMVLVTILASLLSRIVFYEVKTYHKVVDRKQQLQDSRYAFRLIARDIRHIVSEDSIQKATTDSVRFTLIGGKRRSYAYGGNQIYRDNYLLADDIMAFELRYHDGSGDLLSSPVQDPTQIRSISLVMARNVDGRKVSQQIRVTPRNF